MNKDKLKELATQAGFKVFGDKIVAADYSRSGLATVSLEKFAELIVNKCASICYNRALIESEKGSLPSVYKERALEDIGIELMKQFEIE